MPQIKKKGTGAVNIKARIHNLGLATDKLLLEGKKKKKKRWEKSPYFSVT